MTFLPSASKNAFITARSSGELMSTEREAGKESGPRLWLGFIGLAAGPEDGDSDEEEVGKDDRDTG